MRDRIRNLIASAERFLGAGTGAVAAGIAVSGLMSYVFLAIPARSGRLDPSEYAGLSALWFAVYLIGPGLYLPLEQEMARITSRRRARGVDPRAIISPSLKLLGGSLALAMIVLVAARSFLSRELFEQNDWLTVILGLSVIGTGIAQWAKGYLSGMASFGRYGLLVGFEGAIRAVAAAGLAVVGVSRVSPYALLIALAPTAAAVVALWARTGTYESPLHHRGAAADGSATGSSAVAHRPSAADDDEVRVGPLAISAGILAVAQIGAGILMNGVPLVLALAASGEERAIVGRLGAAVVVARIPLFGYQAVQASLLPALAGLAAHRRWNELGRQLGLIAVSMGVLGSLAIVLGALFGPWVTGVMFGAEFTPHARDFAMLTASAVVVILSLVLAQGLIALGSHRLVAVGWICGAAVFALVAWIGSDLIDRALWAGVAGPVAALIVMLISFVGRFRQLRREG